MHQQPMLQQHQHMHQHNMLEQPTTSMDSQDMDSQDMLLINNQLPQLPQLPQLKFLAIVTTTWVQEFHAEPNFKICVAILCKDQRNPYKIMLSKENRKNN